MDKHLQEEIITPSIALNNRAKIPISKDFKILSIDGGGIKGLYVATLLAQIEEKTGRLIGNYFDMICGTSTGGLIALAITNSVPCKQIARFYTEHSPLIFPYEGWIGRNWRLIQQIVFTTKYDNTKLRKAIKELMGDYKTLKDADHFLCIPAFNLTKGRPTVFKKPFGKYHRDGRFTMLEVAMATSAAPTFLPSVKIENDQYVDGGIFANDPSLIGYTEVVDHFLDKTFIIDNALIQYDRISLLSIGLPGSPIGESPDISSRRSFLGWKQKLVNSSMTGMDYLIKYHTDKLVHSKGGSCYYRLNPPPLSIGQLKHIQMDNSSKKAIQTLTTYGQDVGDDFTSSKWNEISGFFSNYRTYKFNNNGEYK